MVFIRDEVARNLLAQHIRECELARAEDRRDRELAAVVVAQSSATQNALITQMHEQNLSKFRKLDEDANARFLKLLWTVIGVLATAATGLAVEFFKLPHLIG